MIKNRILYSEDSMITQHKHNRGQRYLVGICINCQPVLLLLIIGLVGCGVQPTVAPTPAIALPANVAGDSRLVEASGRGTLSTGEFAPDFVFSTVDGSTRLSDLRGKIVIVNFWATWCGPCKQEMPDLQAIADSYGDSVQVVGVNKLELAEVIAPYAEELDVKFTLVANPSGDISERYGVRNLPTTFFIRPDGTIGAWKLGALTHQQIVDVIEQIKQ
jgi:thiol-disulfide isomerase/thioredoxin